MHCDLHTYQQEFMCGNFRSYVPNSMFLGRENETIAESLNPPASPAASSTYKRATVVLASSFPMMGPIPIIQMGTCLALGVTGKSSAVGWAPVHWECWLPSLHNTALFALAVLYGAGSPARPASSMRQPEPTLGLFALLSEESLLPDHYSGQLC